ncbi:MAG: CsgG/HfaB family protein [Thermodesulfovibrionales bacterium]|nr:CsgG/HfaB family protein [Thermodesulfovibrionales bacterium]
MGGLAFAQPEDETYGKDVKERKMSLPKCDAPIGKVVAKGFKCKAAACSGSRLVFSGDNTIQLSPQALGDGMSDMLLTALSETGCFEVYEREALKEIEEELRMLGKTAQNTLKGADFLLTGSITALEMNASGQGGGAGGFAIPLPFIGGIGIKGGKSEAHIGLDLRIIRVNDAKILLSKAVEGKSGRWNFGVGGFGWFGGGGVGGWFGSFKNTPLEEATRDVIAGAVTLIINNMARKNITGTMRVDESGNVVTDNGAGSPAN